MAPDELSLYTAEELIDELMGRSTFQGIVIRAEDSYKGGPWKGEQTYKASWTSNLGDARIEQVLEQVAQGVRRHNERNQDDEAGG
jgi:hypothetical protein